MVIVDFDDMPTPLNPAIIACIHDARNPSLFELKTTVRLLHGEIYPGRPAHRNRWLTLLALAALKGNVA